MKLKRTRTCNDCWASECGHGRRVFGCDLGYKVKTEYTRDSTPIEGIPQELCLKPLTGKAWLEARKAAEAAEGGE